MCFLCSGIKEASEKEKEYKSRRMKLSFCGEFSLPSGKKRKICYLVSKKKGALVVLFCPICGRDLRSE